MPASRSGEPDVKFRKGDAADQETGKDEAPDDDSVFMELLEIQGTLDLVRKTDLIREVRRHGARITDRQLTTYVTEHLVPKSARIGTSGGAYPRIVVDLVTFISLSRTRGMSVQAIKELLPVWRYLKRAIRAREVFLSEFEYISRRHAISPEAVFAIPSMLQEALPCPFCGQAAEVSFKDKNGDLVSSKPLTIGFVMADLDESTGRAEPHAMMRIAILSPDEGASPSTVILGVPNGVPLQPSKWRSGCSESDIDHRQEVSKDT